MRTNIYICLIQTDLKNCSLFNNIQIKKEKEKKKKKSWD